MSETVIIAPHCDDEIIGAYKYLVNNNPIIIYDADMPHERKQEALKLKEHVKIKVQLFQKDFPTHLASNSTILAPDPYFEIHPSHRRWAFIAEQWARAGANVIFYNTIMNAPYIHECKNPYDKERLLNLIYPSQKSLWEYEKKYILFEGYNQWIF